jgi:hypothetical protein
VKQLAGQLRSVEERLRERRARLTEETVFSSGSGLVETAADRELANAAQMVNSGP